MNRFAKSIALFALILCGCSQDKQFDSASWKATPEDERYVFADTLIGGGTLVGKTKEEVERELGKPSHIDAGDGRYSYLIKRDGTGFSRITMVDIEFGKDGLAREVFLRED